VASRSNRRDNQEMSEALRPGDRVHVPGIGSGSLRERRGTRCVVEIKGLPVIVPASRVTAADSDRRARRGAPAASAASDPKTTRRDPSGISAPSDRVGQITPAPPRPLDLHGLTVPEALDALDGFLSDAMLAGAGTVSVVHGRSGGRIRAAVHRRLGEYGSVRGFRVDARNPGQTIVSL
jgi:DNA mismatch repair protein MutS2